MSKRKQIPLSYLDDDVVISRVAVILGRNPDSVFVEWCEKWRVEGFYVDEVGAHREWLVSFEQFYSLPVFPQNRSEWLSDAGWRGQFDTMRRRKGWVVWLVVIGVILLILGSIWFFI